MAKIIRKGLIKIDSNILINTSLIAPIMKFSNSKPKKPIKKK